MKAYFQEAAKIYAKIAKAYRDGNLAKAADPHEPGVSGSASWRPWNFQVPRFWQFWLASEAHSG